MKIIYLEWVDSQRRGHTVWVDRPTAEAPDTLTVIKTVGWLIQEMKTAITVAAHTDETGGDMSGALTIPKAAVLKRRTVGVRKDVK